MGRWADTLVRMRVARGDTPKAITLVLPYYQNPRFLRQQLAVWSTYPAGLRQWLTVIVVDDGSPEPAVLPEDRPCAMRLFRIGVDVRWNWLAARNIGAHHAKDGWMLLTDMDHVVPPETLEALVYGQHDPSVVYAFSRREHTGADVAPHSASFFMTRQMFWALGGYDETLSGFYGTDGDFRRRVQARAPVHVLLETLVRHEYVWDASTTRYQRKQPQDVAVQKLVAARAPTWTPKTLSFQYQEVTC